MNPSVSLGLVLNAHMVYLGFWGIFNHLYSYYGLRGPPKSLFYQGGRKSRIILVECEDLEGQKLLLKIVKGGTPTIDN